MRKFLFLVLCFGQILSANAAVEKINLAQALKQNKISLQASGTNNGFNQKGLRVHLKNLGNTTISVHLEPALIFVAEDSTVQDLIISGDEWLVIGARQSIVRELQSFCGKKSARAPGDENNFQFKKQGDSTLIKVFMYVKANNIDNELAQDAVWFLTSKSSLASVYDPEQKELSLKFCTYIAGLMNISLPQYYTEHNIDNRPGALITNPKPLKLFANVGWKIPDSQTLSLAIYDSTGKRIEVFFDNKSFDRGRYALTAEFETIAYPSGNYFVRLTNKEIVMQEIKVQLE